MSFPELTGNTFPRFGTTGFGEAMDADAETTFSIRMQPKQGRPGSNLDHEVRLSLKNAMVKFITLTTVQSYLGLEDVFSIWLPSIYVIVIVATLIYLGTSLYQSGNSPRANTLDGGKNVHSSVAALRQIILMPMHGCFSLIVINQFYSHEHPGFRRKDISVHEGRGKSNYYLINLIQMECEALLST